MKSRMWLKMTGALCLLFQAATPALAQEQLVNRLYVDFVGRRPSSSELLLAEQLRLKTIPAEKRAIVQQLLKEQLMRNETFENRLRYYFDGLFGVTETHGAILAPCGTLEAGAPCLSAGVAANFRDEAAMLVALTITRGVNDQSYDIRNILTTPFTVMNKPMAQTLMQKVGNEDRVLDKLGLEQIDRDRLQQISSSTHANQWYWINRDPMDLGMPTGTAGHSEHHAGVLTTPTYLIRSPQHLARANNFYQWFMCRNLEQAPVEETFAVKLVERRPCSGCHTLIEPLGSFFVHWRSKINNASTKQDWILDGVKRTVMDNGVPVPTAEDGAIPIDVENPSSSHSRSIAGSFRGKTGTGVAALGKIATADPEFSRCMVRHAWQFLLGRPMSTAEAGWSVLLADKLVKDYNWDLREVFVDIILSGAYSEK